MTYLVDGETFDNAREAADYIMENCDSELYDEDIDEISGDVQIGSLTYSASHVLKNVDPIAYRCGRSDWEDGEACDIEYELERAETGTTVNFYGFDVEVADDEELAESC